jgi:glycosyltransferase involved in cell wall biosynthesis
MTEPTESSGFPLRIGIQQRVLPAYRAAFFESLAAVCPAGLSVFAGQPWAGEAMGPQARLEKPDFTPTHNLYLLGGRFVLVWQPGLRRWLENWQPSALILEANPRNQSNPLAVRWAHTHGCAVIGWGLGAPPSGGILSALRLGGWRSYLSQFDALITYSRKGMDEFSRQGFPAERIFTAPNAVSARPSAPPPPRADAFDGQPTILYVGRLQERKRVDLLLRACAAQPGTMRPRLWIVGDGPARPQLETLAQQVFPSAEFFGDRRGPDLDSIFNRADLFVLPGTGGLAVQQAMGFGLPVAVAQADGTQADLVRPENGWRLPDGDLGALSDVIGQALQDPARLRRMGAASFRIVADEINLDNMVKVFVQAANSAVARVKQP